MLLGILIICPNRTFLRRMIDLSSVAKELHHHSRVSRAFRLDLSWWALFLEQWHGVSLFTSVVRSSFGTTLTSDASGTCGCGAFTSTGEWLQLRWPSVWEKIHITVKELLPIMVACATWGHSWQRKTVRSLCDNAAVVAILRSGTSKHSLAMHLLRCLLLFQLVPTAHPHPALLPLALIWALLLQTQDWMSASWRAMLRSTLLMA